MNLTQKQLERAVERGQALCAKLMKDYPELQLYPVFSRFGQGSGQCALTFNPLDIAKEFPKMMTGPQAKRLGQLLQKHKKASKLKSSIKPDELKEVKNLKSYISETKDSLYLGDTHIEYRCGILQYESLRRLQQDPRLPPDLNTVGNIRVIAGSLEMLANERD